MSLEREDYIMRQIMQLGQVLARMLARLINIKQVPDAGLSLDEIRQIYGDELIKILTTDLKFIDQHLENMADILSETADILENNMDIRDIPFGLEPARELRQKGIILLEHLQATSGVYSLERIARITQLKELL